jgi:hypothetical protein
MLNRIEVAAVEGSGAGSPLMVDQPLQIPAGGVVSLGANGTPPITVPGASSLRPGEVVSVTLSFRQAGSVDMQVPLYPATGPYATVTPGQAPSATASPLTPSPGEATLGPGSPTPSATQGSR